MRAMRRVCYAAVSAAMMLHARVTQRQYADSYAFDMPLPRAAISAARQDIMSAR